MPCSFANIFSFHSLKLRSILSIYASLSHFFHVSLWVDDIIRATIYRGLLSKFIAELKIIKMTDYKLILETLLEI